METREIAEALVRGAKAYLGYLQENEKGFDRAAVSAARRLKKGEFGLSGEKELADAWVLHLSKRPFDTDSILMEVEGHRYDGACFDVLGTAGPRDLDLGIRFKGSLALAMASAVSGRRLSKVFVVSDMKFLVKRTGDWFATHGGCLAWPVAPAVFAGASGARMRKVAERLDAMGLSDEQRRAVAMALKQPFSYVWGAPGTGKTRGVLAASVLSTVLAGGRVAVVAPTNNALEQSLRGLLEVLRQEDVDLMKVLRMGTPSSSFRREFPMCCEKYGVAERVQDLGRQEKALSEVPLVLKRMAGVASLEGDLSDLGELVRGQEAAALARSRALSTQLDELNRMADQTRASIAVLRQMGPAAGDASPLDALETMLAHLEETIRRQSTQIVQGESPAVQALVRQVKEKASLTGDGDLVRIVTHLSQGSFGQVMDLVREHVAGLKKALPPWALASLAEGVPPDKVVRRAEKKFQECQEALSKLVQGEEKDFLGRRMRGLKVVAMTADAWIGRFAAEAPDHYVDKHRFEPDHVFLDEAGYCSLAKGMALVSGPWAVTFLGDHRQLPPVCEMDRESIPSTAEGLAFSWAQSAIHAERLFTGGLKESVGAFSKGEAPLFQKMAKRDLTATFRFGPSLCGILDEFVYGNGFHSALSGDSSSGRFSLELLSVAKSAGREKRQNPAEVEAILRWLERESPEDFVVLTPYANQVRLLKDRFHAEGLERERVMTVHASQGREWDTVILSVVDTADKWFTDSRKRMTFGLEVLNTAVSRARRRLLVVCDGNYWSSQGGQLVGRLVQEGMKAAGGKKDGGDGGDEDADG